METSLLSESAHPQGKFNAQKKVGSIGDDDGGRGREI
jgi:hypothetical protein